jgi:TolB-like protein
MSKKICRGVAFVLSLVITSSGLFAKAAAQPAAQYTLAVLPLEISGRITAEEGTTLTNRLAAELARTGIFIVTDQSAVQSTLQAAGLPLTACSSVDCGMQAGKLLATQLVANGSIRKVGQLYFVEVQLLHSNSGRVVQNVNEDFDGDVRQLLNFMTTVARKLVGKSAAAETAGAVSAAPEQSGMTMSNDTYGGGSSGSTPAPTSEVRSGGGNKFLYIGLAAVGAAGAVYGITQLTKDSDGKNNGKTGPSTDLPNPPRFP